MLATSGSRFVVERVAIAAQSLFSAGIIGIDVYGGSFTMRGSTISLTGSSLAAHEGMRISTAPATIEYSTVSSITSGSNSNNYGMHVFNANVLVGWSTIEAIGGVSANRAIEGSGASTFVGVKASQLRGSAAAPNGAVLKCAASFDDDLNMLSSACF